jgi:transposase
MTYSIDFRMKAVDCVLSGMTWDNAVAVFKISKHTLNRWIKKHHAGDLGDAARCAYKPRKIDSALLLQAIEVNPDATLQELATQFGCGFQSIHKRLITLGVTRKKKHAIQGAKRGKKTSISGGVKHA